jgi:superfamily II DNA or RNA helicase
VTELDASQLPERGARLLVKGQMVTVIDAVADGDRVDLVIRGADGKPDDLTLSAAELADSLVVANDGRGSPVGGLAGLWSRWMQYAVPRIRSAVLATRPLRPYAHQDEAVFAHMLAQPRLRFLLADEPGTGKTVMTGMYLAEASRRGLIQGSTVIVVPKHLVAKWQRDLLRHFAIDARQLTAEIARDPADLDPRYNVWVVSVDLFTRNSDVRRRVAGPDASWSLAVFDEAHRLTPTSQYLGAAQELSARVHHLLLLTATPHRGKEHFFRALLNLLDSDLYPWDPRTKTYQRPLRPSELSFLRRMKEDLKDFDGTDLFPARYAEVVPAELEGLEDRAYQEVMGYVDTFFADNPTLPRSVYGRRAASSLVAVRQTLQRRMAALESAARDRMGDLASADLLDAVTLGRIDDDDVWERAEQAVVSARTQNARAERERLGTVLSTVRLALVNTTEPAKWRRLMELLDTHGIAPGTGQLLVFTEFTDTARWLASLFRDAGFETETLEGSLGHDERDALQQRFLAGRFQVLVSTDAGGEGIDLQSAHVMINWDIPWSLVRLEQRMGRLHRIGQRNDVYIYHLVSPGTREGRVQRVLLDNINQAGRSLHGRIYDLLDATAERVNFDYTSAMVSAQASDSAADAVHIPDADELRTAAEQLHTEERRFSTRDAALAAAEARFRDDRLEAVNPVIVDGFIDRLAPALGWELSAGPAPGIRRVRSSSPLPESLRSNREALIAADGVSVSQARADGAVDLDDVVTLGPTEPAFTQLVELGIGTGDPALVRGVRLIDAASRSGYILFVFAAEVHVSDEVGRRTRKQTPLLVRHSGRDTFVVPWEAVLKLMPDNQQVAATVPAPGVRADADRMARRALADEVAREQAVREAWVGRIRRGLDEVEIRFQDDIEGLPTDIRGRRMRAFEQLRSERLDQLDELSTVEASAPRLLGWAEVLPGATTELGYDPDSEAVAIQVVWAELEQLGFEIDDRQSAGLGYDLLARHRRTGEQRLVEVKGQLRNLEAVWLEQNEWAQAQQRGSEYWLYVVTNCATDPVVTVRAKDPATQVGMGVRRIERYQIPVIELRRMAGRGQM